MNTLEQERLRQLFSLDKTERQAAVAQLQAEGKTAEELIQAAGLNAFGIYKPSDFSTKRPEISVYGRRLPSLEPLTVLPKIASLSIHKSYISDWSALPRLQGLRSLDFCVTNVPLSVLAPLQGIESLSFDFQEIKSLDFIIGWDALTDLSVMGWPWRSLDAFPDLPALQRLTVMASNLPYEAILAFQERHPEVLVQHSYPPGDALNARLLCSGIPENIEYVKNRLSEAEIQILCFEQGWAQFGLNSAADFIRRDAIDIAPHTCSDIQALSTFWALEALRADDNAIRDLRPLTGMHRLKRLSLSRNDLDDIRPLEALFQLKAVALNGNPSLQDLTPLRAAQTLERLMLAGTGVRDLSPLTELSQLTHLDISHCPITDLSPLYALPLLTEVVCEGVKLTGEQLISFHIHCSHCSLEL